MNYLILNLTYLDEKYPCSMEVIGFSVSAAIKYALRLELEKSDMFVRKKLYLY